MEARVINRPKHNLQNCLTESYEGISILDSPGTIETDCRGEDCIIPVNLYCQNFVIKDEDLISKSVTWLNTKDEWVQVENLVETNRGCEGFDHTEKE